MKLFGLPVCWRVTYDWRTYGWHAPRVVAGRLVQRADEIVVGLDPASGSIDWKLPLTGGGAGYVVATVGERFVTDFNQRRPSQRSLVGISAAGERVWEVPIVGQFARSWSVFGNTLSIPDTAVEQSALVVVDGEGRTQRLPVAVLEVIAEDGAWVLAKRYPAEGVAPLFRWAPSGVLTSSHDVRGGVWKLLAVGDRLVTVEQQREPAPHRITVRDRETLAVLWEANGGGTVTADREHVVYVSHDTHAPILADLATGEVRWKGAPMPRDPGRIILAGPVVLFGSAATTTVYDRRGTFLETSDLSISHTGELDEAAGRVYLGVENGAVALSIEELP